MDSVREELGALAQKTLQLLQKHRNDDMKRVSRVKSPGNITTKADEEAEAFLIEKLSEKFPSIPVLSEEADWDHINSDRYFLVDPLDGTSNFYKGLGHFSVAIALMEQGEVLVSAAAVGEVCEIFTAEKGGGAYLNEQPLRIRSKPKDAISMIACSSHGLDRMLPLLKWFLTRKSKIRNLGSVVSHICHVAAQRFDLSICQDVHIWDIAAPSLIISEAGGYAGDFKLQPIFPFKRSVYPGTKALKFDLIASNGHAHIDIPTSLLRAGSNGP